MRQRVLTAWHEHGSNLISNVTGGLPCKRPPSLGHYKSPNLVSRTVGSILSGTVGGSTGPISDLVRFQD